MCVFVNKKKYKDYDDDDDDDDVIDQSNDILIDHQCVRSFTDHLLLFEK